MGRWWWVGVVLGLVSLVWGVIVLLDDDPDSVVGPVTASSTSSGEAEHSSAHVEPSEPSSTDAGALSTGDQSAEGAAAAAVGYLELSEEIVGLTPEEAGAMQREISTTAVADELSATVEAQMVELNEAVPSGMTLWVAPIETRSSPNGPGYEVSIWYVEVVAIGGSTAASSFKTITFQLVWEDGWKSAGSSVVAGPAPSGSQSPTPELELVSLLEGYDDSALVVPVN